MRKSWMLIAAACGLAAAVFGATLFIGPSAPTDESAGAGDLVPEIPTGSGDPGSPGSAGSPGGSGGGDLGQLLVGRSQGGKYFFRHARQPGEDADPSDKERWTLIEWERFTPLPDDRMDVTRPRTRTYLGNDRVMTMEADRGNFVAPENQPKSGDLVGNVILRVFVGEEGREANLAADSPDLQTVVYLDEAHFDLELAQIDSGGPVHLTGDDIDFRGTGLSLNHNQLRNRLERLEIGRGDTLRFRRNPGEEEAEPRATATGGAAPRPRRPRQAAVPVETGVPDPAPPAVAATGEEPAAPPAAPAPPATATPPSAVAEAPPAGEAEAGDQYYRATFEKDVRVTSGGASEEAADITADKLAAIFSMGGDGQDEGDVGANAPPAATPTTAASGDAAAAPAPAAATTAAAPRPRRRPATPAVGDRSAPASPEAPAAEPVLVSERSRMVAREDDVVVRWTGRLLVEPLERKPRPMAGPDDILLTLTGEPVHVRTGQDETVTSREVTFLASAGRIEASGSEDNLVRLESPKMGTVAGTELVINQALANGHVRGPGWLKGRVQSPTDDPATAAAATPSEELEVAWTDRLDLTFHRAEGAGRGDGGSGGLTLGASSDLEALRTAVFRGDVMANHPRFHLGGDSISLALSAPADGNTLQAIEGQGRVQMAARGEADEERFDIASQQLRITMEADEKGRPSPRRVAASGDVVANRPNMRLNAQQLAITLVPEATAAPAEAAPADADADPRLAVDRLVATGGVEVHLVEQDVTLTGDRLAGDVGSDHLELFGSDAEPAKVVQPEGTLVGQRILFGQTSQTVRVEMPGHLVLASLPGKRRGSLRVDWREAMRFSNKTGLATFTGGVQTQTSSPTDTTRLDAQTLDVQFEAATATPPEAADAPAPAAGEDADGPASRPQQVRTATARGEVRFRADRFAEGKPDELITQFSLRGPEMAFDNAPGAEAVRVNGAGRMGIIDNRPATAPAADGTARAAPAAPAAPAAAGVAAVKVSGRGATLFDWTGRLIMNAAENDLTLEGGVRMTHRPAEGGPPIFFDADHVVADLEERTGEATWLEDEGPQPEIKQITATGNVLIRRDTLEVEADKLVYTEADRKVVLTAAEGGVVQVRRSDLPVPLLGKRIEWNLANDSFDVQEPVGSMAPIRSAPERRGQRR